MQHARVHVGAARAGRLAEADEHALELLLNARGISERVSRGVEVRAPLEKGFLQQVRDQGGLFLPDRKPECLTAKAKSSARASMSFLCVWPGGS